MPRNRRQPAPIHVIGSVEPLLVLMACYMWMLARDLRATARSPVALFR